MSSSKRHFTAVVGSKEHGLYISSSPSSAARKIVSKLCVASKSKKVEFCVREITQSSKKKTYGPYLGEMKKLAKPIELKGRIIRYAPEVHLKKKKSAIKTVIKLDKKMRGGTIKNDGIVSIDDFIFDIDIDSIPNFKSITHISPQGVIIGSIYPIPKEIYNNIPECILKEYSKTRTFKKNITIKYIFFSKKLLDNPLINNKNNTFKLTEPRYKYEYVVFLSEGNVIFQKFNDNQIREINISKIPRKALNNLKKFIEKERELNTSLFYDIIYEAVNKELDKNNRLENNNYGNYVELNEIKPKPNPNQNNNE